MIGVPIVIDGQHWFLDSNKRHQYLDRVPNVSPKLELDSFRHLYLQISLVTSSHHPTSSVFMKHNNGFTYVVETSTQNSNPTPKTNTLLLST